VKLLWLLLALVCGAVGQEAGPAVYTLGPDDQIVIRVLDLEEFGATTTAADKPYRIDLRGFVNLPLVGRVKAGGQNIEAFEAELVGKLREFVKEPQVTVMVTEYRSQPISILGQVTQPGVHQLQGRKSLFEVISMAGGLKPEAGYTIKIVRKKQYGAIPLATAKTDTTGEYSVAEVSVKGIMNADHPEENLLIQPFDVITVPKAELVYVVGTVKKSGGFTLAERENVTVLQALSMAEGFGPQPADKECKILRRNGSSDRLEIPVNLNAILKGKAPDVPMQSEDILFVPSSMGKKVVARAAESAIALTTGLLIWRR
jgi:polysaccharide export outer membrane protein